ncbi:MAG: glycosyltransferase [Deltaproteobacteria bacterium]|nr:glycosyltransferase [Deltaproteobacteria bacterium]
MVKASVIIPTRNGEQNVGQLLATLKQQSVKPSQILIVDSSSEDDTLKICEAFDVDLIKINAGSFNHGGTRNMAASKATGDILIYMTQDAALRDSTVLAILLNSLEDPSVAAVYGRQVPREDANPIERFARYFNYPSNNMTKGLKDLPALGVKTFFFSNVFSAVRKNAFEKVGGFPDNTIMNEDMFLAARLIQNGYKIAYQADAVVYHSHSYSLSTQFKRYFDIGVFFSRNRWIMDLAKSEREGIRYLKELLVYLIANKEWFWLPYAIFETMLRFFGYRIGLIEGSLPLWFKKRISYNKSFWIG